ncbi:MAG: FAD-binding oxidoreductase [Myxococcales bacterium]
MPGSSPAPASCSTARRCARWAPGRPSSSPKAWGGALLVEFDGHGDGVAEELGRAGELCAEQGAIDVLAAQDEAQRRKIWETRRMTSVAMTDIRPFKISEDVAVPRGKLVELIREVRKIGEKHGLPTACYGHAGDGNLHVNLLFASLEERHQGESAVWEVLDAAIRLGGTITGEHGVGVAKRPFLAREQAAPVIDLQKRVKQAFDPENLLNPGKIFPA